MSIPLRKTLLIVCEGECTEPNYFYDLQKLIEKKGLDYRITILPKPPLKKYEEELEQVQVLRNNKRPRRALKVIPNEHLLPEMIPEEYKAQPIRYVWYAYDGLDVHDEVWSVYDKDGHTHHAQARAFAAEKEIEGKKINIAYSSIAFELWYLLHFESIVEAFEKVHCRTGEIPHYCGQGSEKDCKGEICITGYIKSKGYFGPEENIKGFRFEPIADKTAFAISNAVDLRNTLLKSGKSILEGNPYTDVDRLVFKLLFLEEDYKWIDPIYLGNHSISLSYSFDNEALKCTITNNSDNTFIFLPTHCTLVNVKGEKMAIYERSVLLPGASKLAVMNHVDIVEFEPKFISYQMDNCKAIFEI